MKINDSVRTLCMVVSVCKAGGGGCVFGYECVHVRLRVCVYVSSACVVCVTSVSASLPS